MEYGKITKDIMDWAESKGQFTWTELHTEYKRTGANSMSYHLPNWTNENTNRKCGRYLHKSGSSYKVFTSPRHKHLPKLLILHKRMRDCKHYYKEVNASLDVYDPLVDAMADLCSTIGCCKEGVNYKIPPTDMQTFNYWYKESNVSKYSYDR